MQLINPLRAAVAVFNGLSNASFFDQGVWNASETIASSIGAQKILTISIRQEQRGLMRPTVLARWQEVVLEDNQANSIAERQC